jgi:hypothetical protein
VAVIAGHEFRTPELILTGAGVVMLIDSLLPWRGYDANGWHPTYSAFQSGFWPFIAVVIVVLVAGTAATRAWAASESAGIGSGQLTWNALFLLADAAAFLLILLFWATLPSLEGVSTGVKIGTFIGLVAVLVQAAGAFLAMVAAGERLPWKLPSKPRGSTPA